MPYIPRERRRRLLLNTSESQTAGELNYLITSLVEGYLPDDYGYSDLNAVVGVLECVKQELYRRVVAPYEDVKCAENGDVFPS